MKIESFLHPTLYQFRLHRSGWGVIPGEWSVGECGIIDLDFIIPIQPETILQFMCPSLDDNEPLNPLEDKRLHYLGSMTVTNVITSENQLAISIQDNDCGMSCEVQ